MAGVEGQTAEVVYGQKNNGQGYPVGRSAAFICPYPECGVFAQHTWALITEGAGFITGSTRTPRQVKTDPILVTALCESCNQEVVFLAGKVIAPSKTDAPTPTPDMPADVTADFEEARQIFHKSPRGAAALLRLSIQKLCVTLGSGKTDINAAIGELVKNGKISAELQRALDSVRVIGNEAVHPGVMNLKDDTDTALALFGLVNFIVEKGIAEPKRIAAIYASLPPGKLAGIARRDRIKALGTSHVDQVIGRAGPKRDRASSATSACGVGTNGTSYSGSAKPASSGKRGGGERSGGGSAPSARP